MGQGGSSGPKEPLLSTVDVERQIDNGVQQFDSGVEQVLDTSPTIPDDDPVYISVDLHPEAYKPMGPWASLYLAAVLILLPLVTFAFNMAFVRSLVVNLHFWPHHLKGVAAAGDSHFLSSTTTTTAATTATAAIATTAAAPAPSGHRPLPLPQWDRFLLFCALGSVFTQCIDVVGLFWCFGIYIRTSSYAKVPGGFSLWRSWPVVAGFVAFLNYQYQDLNSCTRMRLIRLITTTVGAVPQMFATAFYLYYIARPAELSKLIPLLSLYITYINVVQLYSFEGVWNTGRLCFDYDWYQRPVQFWVLVTVWTLVIGGAGIYGFHYRVLPIPHVPHVLDAHLQVWRAVN